MIILALSVMGNNQSVAVAAAILLLVKLLGLDSWFPAIENHGLSIGVTILTIAVLTPLATGRLGMKDMTQALSSPVGLIALAVGVFVAWSAGRGLVFVSVSPEMVTSLILGTVVGVCFFQGIPVGPLIAAGIVSLLLAIGKLLK